MDQIIADTGTRDQANGATKRRTKDHLPKSPSGWGWGQQWHDQRSLSTNLRGGLYGENGIALPRIGTCEHRITLGSAKPWHDQSSNARICWQPLEMVLDSWLHLHVLSTRWTGYAFQAQRLFRLTTYHDMSYRMMSYHGR